MLKYNKSYSKQCLFTVSKSEIYQNYSSWKGVYNNITQYNIPYFNHHMKIINKQLQYNINLSKITFSLYQFIPNIAKMNEIYSILTYEQVLGTNNNLKYIKQNIKLKDILLSCQKGLNLFHIIINEEIQLINTENRQNKFDVSYNEKLISLFDNTITYYINTYNNTSGIILEHHKLFMVTNLSLIPFPFLDFIR